MGKFNLIFFCLCLLFLSSCSTQPIEHLIIEQDLENINVAERSKSDMNSSDFLDYGIYWFNANNESFKGFNESKNRAIDVPVNLYDPTKPTVVYFHGWAQGSSKNNYKRENFQINNDRLDLNLNTISAWKNKGWNVAIFYWNQFGDENKVTDAEAKIWSVKGAKKMRYRLKNGKYSNLKSPKYNLSTIAFNQLKSVLSKNSSNNIRIVGHSLGSQLAVSVSYLMNEAVKNGKLKRSLMPNRIELLDPFWSRGAKAFLADFNNDGNKDWTGERVRFYIKEIKEDNNTAITWYKSSAILNLGLGDNNDDLKQEVAFQSFRPWYLNGFDLVNKHVYVRHNYFWSMSFRAPKEVKLDFFRRRSKTGRVSASASTSNARIKQLMNSGYFWDQVEGRRTASPKDNQFQIKKW